MINKLALLLSFVQDKRGVFIDKLVRVCKELDTGLDLYLDSGAFTAMMSGNPIRLEQYAAFLEQNASYATWYANLDSIGDSVETLQNQRRLESMGFHPVPVFHQGSSTDIFRSMLYEYSGKIALGGIAGKPRWMFPLFLKACAEICRETPTDKDNHLHLFGVTPTKEICEIHQWGSFDSSIGAGYRWNRVMSPYGTAVALSSLKSLRNKSILINSFKKQLSLSQRTLDIIEEAKKPTRGYDSGSFWDAVSMLCTIKVVQDILDTVECDALYYTVFSPIKSPYLEMIISGAKDIYENRNNTNKSDRL